MQSTRPILKASYISFSSPMARNFTSLSGSSPKWRKVIRLLTWLVPPIEVIPITAPFRSFMLLNLFCATKLKKGALMPVEMAHRQAFGCGADNRTDQLRIVDIAAQQRSHCNVRAHLDQFDIGAVLEVKPAILGHEGNKKRHRTCGDGDADFFRCGFVLRMGHRRRDP